MGVVAQKSGNRPGHSLVGRRLGRYEVLAKLASGGMASVYVARAQGVAGFERLVAIKILHSNLAHEEEFVKMFLDEARLAARIRHPNVVPTLDISDTIDAGYFIVMEYIEGDHLGQLLAGAAKRTELLPQTVVMRIGVDALSGLGAAHRLTGDEGKPLNLVHRDVSPHNIMVGLDGISRLTDFGVAKAEDRLTHTRDGQIKGKLAYMAPEQASVGRTDPRSDLFSIGIILWESLTGRRLFRAETTAGTLNKLVSDPIPLPSSANPQLEVFDPVLEKALSRDPDARYQNADEFIEAMEALAKKVGGLASLREVGKAVNKFAAERIQHDKKRIKEAIQTFGTAEISSAVRPQGADDIISEPSGRSWTSSSGTSGSSPSVSGPSSMSGVSKMSGVYAQATMPSTASRRAPLRPPRPPKAEVTVADEIIALSDADLEASELSILSASQIGAPPVSHTRWLVLLTVGFVVLAAVALWAVTRDRETGVKVYQMEETPSPAEAKSSTAEIPEPAEPEAEAEPVEPEEPEKKDTEKPSREVEPKKAMQAEKKPPVGKRKITRKPPKPKPVEKKAAAEPEPEKPRDILQGILKEPEPTEKKPPPKPEKKTTKPLEFDPVNPYRR